MQKVWIILANATSATIYMASERDRHFQIIKKLSCPEAKLKNQDLVTDRPGHYQKSHDPMPGSYAETTDPKTLTMEHFAKEIIAVLEQGRTQNAYQHLIMVSGPHFYGLLHKEANSHIQKLIKYHLSKDYTHYAEDTLKTALESELGHELRLLFLS